MILQLNPMIPILRVSDSLEGYAFLVIDYSQEHDLLFTCAMDNGEIWTLNNKEIRFCKNISMDRSIITKTNNIEEQRGVWRKVNSKKNKEEREIVVRLLPDGTSDILMEGMEIEFTEDGGMFKKGEKGKILEFSEDGKFFYYNGSLAISTSDKRFKILKPNI